MLFNEEQINIVYWLYFLVFIVKEGIIKLIEIFSHYKGSFKQF